jgi:alcohol dehydrogenase class IV
MVKKSGEPTSEFIDNFISNIKLPHDLIIAIGGGSLIDFAKVIAVLIANPSKKTKEVYGIRKRNKAIDLVAVPTTAGTGTEVTGVSVVIDSESLLKFGVLGDDLIPKYAILDPVLSISLNLRYTISTGVDALTHALEAFCSKQSFYMTDLYAESAIKIIWETLPTLHDDLNNLQLREKMLYASMLAGIAFGTAGTGAVHGFAHIVGGKYGVSHGEANSILLSRVMWYNFDYNDRKIKSLFGGL